MAKWFFSMRTGHQRWRFPQAYWSWLEVQKELETGRLELAAPRHDLSLGGGFRYLVKWIHRPHCPKTACRGWVSALGASYA